MESLTRCDLGTYSHYPFLAAVVARTSGPVVEFGVGWGSSPLLHYLCRGRRLLSADTDAAWLALWEGYRVGAHEFRRVVPLRPIVAGSSGVNEMIEAWVAFAHEVAELKPDVVFLDQAPGEARVPCALVLKGHVKFLLCHDREADEPGGGGNYRWRDLEGRFKYQTISKRMGPWTAVYSDVEEFPIEAVDA